MKKSLAALGLLAAIGLGGEVIAAAAPAGPPPDPNTPWWAYGFAGPPAPAAAGGGRGGAAQGGGRGGAPGGPPGAAPGAPGAPGGAAGGAAGGRGGAPGAGGGRAPPDPTLYTLPGSTKSFTTAQTGALYAPADWYPEDHPVMPEIVAHGKEADRVMACALCHMPNGMGRTESANLTGLSEAYLNQQMKDFAAGRRVTSDSRKSNTATMSNFAKLLTEEETRQAVAYFASVKPRPDFITVKEVTNVPKTRPQGGIFFVATGADAGEEPLAGRIIETPVDSDQTEKFRNPRSGFVAYVPVGSVARGKALVETGGNGRFTACKTCHGQDLRGAGPIPAIAGRSPAYMMRQLNDMQQGNRTGEWTVLMAPVVSAMTQADMINIVAYLASLKI